MSLNNPRAAPAASPCIGLCSHNVGDLICRGCGRSIEEVRDWNSYSTAQKLAIKARLATEGTTDD